MCNPCSRSTCNPCPRFIPAGISGSALPLTLDARQCKDFELTPLTALQVTQVTAPFMSVNVNNQFQYNTQSAGTPALGKVALYTVSGGELGAEALKTVSQVVSVIQQPEKMKFTVGVTVNSSFDFINNDPAFVEAARQFGGYDLPRWGENSEQGKVYFRIGGPHGDYKDHVPDEKRQWRIFDKPGVTNASQSTLGWKDLGYDSNSNKLFLGDLPDWVVPILGAKRVEYGGIVHRFVRCRFPDDVKKYDITPERPPLSPSTKFLSSDAAYDKGFYYNVPGPQKSAAGHVWKKVGDKFYGAIWIQRWVEWKGWLLNNPVLTPTVLIRDSVIIPNITTTTNPKAGYLDSFRAPPAGFTQGMLESQNYLPYGGKASIVEDQCGGQRYMPRCLNFSNSQPAHTSIHAMVTEETLDLGTGITTIYLGPPARYNYDDLVSRLRPEPNAQIIQG
jgi:hypothetical protein